MRLTGVFMTMLWWTLAAAGGDAPADVLQTQLDRTFSACPATWGCAVVDLADGKPVYLRAPGQPLVPASNQKLVTIAAALLELGPDYTCPTRIYAEGTVRDGTLDGNLVVAGYGAMDFSARHLDQPIHRRVYLIEDQLSQVVAGLRAAGVRRIRGRLLADCSDYTDEPLNQHYLCAGPLSFNENTLDVEARNGHVQTCPDFLVSFSVVTRPGLAAQQRQVDGRDAIGINPLRDDVDYWRLEGMRPEQYYLAQLANAFSRRRLIVDGTPMRGGERTLLLEVPCRPLHELLPATGVTSDNFRAEAIFLHLGYKVKGKATYANAAAAVPEVLKRGNLDLPSLTVVDGSGLSHSNRAAPYDLVRLIAAMHGSAHGRLFDRCLAEAGATGTLRNHLQSPELRGKLRAKTGTLNGVRSLSGLITTQSGRTLAFSFIANDLSSGPAYWIAVERAALLLVRE